MKSDAYKWTWLFLRTIMRTLFFMADRNHDDGDDDESFL